MVFAESSCKASEMELERLMTCYGDEIKQLYCLYTKDMALAEDAAQETFIKAWRSYDQFRGDCSEKWIDSVSCKNQKHRKVNGLSRIYGKIGAKKSKILGNKPCTCRRAQNVQAAYRTGIHAGIARNVRLTATGSE